MSARNDTFALIHSIAQRTGVTIEFDHANSLRRAQMTLHRWSELECGDGNDHCSWAIERGKRTPEGFVYDENGAPYLMRYWHDGKVTNQRMADREKGALKRIKAICDFYGLTYYHQTDPRGCALYVSREPIKDHDYTNGVACCA